MSNKSELQSNNTDLQTILEMVTNLPEAGKTINTCSINITTSTGNPTIEHLIYSKLENGSITIGYIENTQPPINLDNVVCGSAFFGYKDAYSWGTPSNATVYYQDEWFIYMKTPETPGDTVNFSVKGLK